MSAERWLLYALGGGMGHLTRAVALGRAARRRGHRVELVTNSAFAPLLPLETELGGSGVHRLDARLDKHAVREALERLLHDVRPEVLVVDTFPRGLGRELAPLLPGLKARKVLVHRDLHPDYVERFELERFLDPFDGILVPGEPAPFAHHPRAVRTPPWLVLDAAELLDVPSARRVLGVAGRADAVVAVLGCGRKEEVDEYAELARALRRGLGPDVHVQLLAPDVPPRLWPALAVMRGIDVLVGAGGYNTVQEARATGTPLVALARPRLYDRQAVRLRDSERLASLDEALGRVGSLLKARQAPRAQGAPPLYLNGTHEAVRIIEEVARP